MLRAIGGVIGGYIAMFIVVFVTFTASYLLMGADRAFKPGTYDVSTLWLGLAVVVSLVAAAVGGLFCTLIAAPGSKAPKVLAGVVLVLGLLMMIPVFMDSAPDPGPRTADVPNLEAMTKAKQPKWTAALNPVIGAAGVMLGAGMLAKKKPGAS